MVIILLAVKDNLKKQNQKEEILKRQNLEEEI
jgi:hypothetical protein